MKTYLIDDDFISNFVTEKVLENENFGSEIISFLTAEEALATLLNDMTHHTPDVIFLDLNMPGMNGWAFLDALAPHKEALLNKCHIYILTSSLNLADTALAKDYELVHGLLHKPIDQQDIRMVLAELEDHD